jgi:hypothetical protein
LPRKAPLGGILRPVTSSLIARWAAVESHADGSGAVYGIGYWPDGALEDAHERGATGNLVSMRMTDAAFDYVSEHGGAPSPSLRVASPETSLQLTGVRYRVWLAREEARVDACIVRDQEIRGAP